MALLEAIIPAAATLIGADMRNRAATQAAANQQAFQERMSSTAYQRAMQDMREAGLNPMLAAKVGGASTPGGAMPNLSNIFGEAAGVYTSAYQAETGRRQQEEQAQQLRAAANLADAQAVKIKAETQNVRSQSEVIAKTVKHLEELIVQTGTNSRVLEAQAKVLGAQLQGTQAASKLKNLDATAMQRIEDAAVGGSATFKLLQMLLQVLK